MKDQQRKKDLKTARKIQSYNIAYDISEVAVSLTAGFTSGSSALIGWGLDILWNVVKRLKELKSSWMMKPASWHHKLCSF